MSIWTHVLGAVRFDTIGLNMWPKPHNIEHRVHRMADAILDTFLRDVPGGSEGPLDVDVVVTNRGPTVVIAGDLRDFSFESVDKIEEWLKTCIKDVEDEFGADCYLRDAVVDCHTEGIEQFTMLVDRRGIYDRDEPKIKRISADFPNEWTLKDYHRRWDEEHGGENNE